MTAPDGPAPWRGERPNDGEPEWWERAIDGTDPAEGLDKPERDEDSDSGPDFDDLPETFIPPEPPPLPMLAPATVLGTLGILSGLFFVLQPEWLANALAIDPVIVMLLGVGTLLSGAFALLNRLRDPDDDEAPPPPDNGAVV